MCFTKFAKVTELYYSSPYELEERTTTLLMASEIDDSEETTIK